MSLPIAVLAISDMPFRERIRNTLTGLRWQVFEADGGAQALARLEAAETSAVIMDAWFPDLEVTEFVKEVETTFPNVDLISTDGCFENPAKARNNRHGELLYALRINQEWDGAAFKGPADSQAVRMLSERRNASTRQDSGHQWIKQDGEKSVRGGHSSFHYSPPPHAAIRQHLEPRPNSTDISDREVDCSAKAGLAEFVGSHPLLLEVCRRIHLVAPRITPVLIQGPSGTGKELVARALHRLSPRSNKAFIALNCAAIPDTLLEAELFGHTKGAFTGAMHGRLGRIEAANGGTLFLDEIGEMPLVLQAKLLRFLEAGEVQRVGENETVHVDARIVAATNQQLGSLTKQGLFRADLFYRLAVFLIETPSLSSHVEDIPVLGRLFLSKLSDPDVPKSLSSAALDKLQEHSWPGNVRELSHVIERAFIFAQDRKEITEADLEFASIES